MRKINYRIILSLFSILIIFFILVLQLEICVFIGYNYLVNILKYKMELPIPTHWALNIIGGNEYVEPNEYRSIYYWFFWMFAYIYNILCIIIIWKKNEPQKSKWSWLYLNIFQLIIFILLVFVIAVWLYYPFGYM